jgi:intein-encoded DNA endonuclease-like protein
MSELRKRNVCLPHYMITMTEEKGVRINGDDVLKDRQSANTHDGTSMSS